MVPSAAGLATGPTSRPATGPTRRPATGSGRRAVTFLGTDDRSSSRVRLVDAALGCIARQGLHKTTVDDIARQAGVSRATLYRNFPGGKEAVLAAVVETEVARWCSSLAVVMGEARDLPDVLVAGIVETTRLAAGHAALQYLLANEPEVVLPYLAFGKLDRLLLAASAFAAPFFGRWLDPEQAARAAEWATRITLSYFVTCSERMDLADPAQVRHLVSTFVVPGIQALRAADQGDRADRPPPAKIRPGTRPGERKGAQR